MVMLLILDKWLLRLAVLLLALVGAVKIFSAFSGVRYLNEFDPILPFLRNKQVLVIAGNMELCLALLILFYPNKIQVRLGLLALCFTFLIYRFGLFTLNIASPCPCLGRATDWLHITAKQADILAKILLSVFGLISVISIAIYYKVFAKHIVHPNNSSAQPH
jgi:hypothetical protein